MTYRDDEWSEMFADLRKEAGLTQRRAAIEAGLSQNYVRTIENRKISPTVRNLDKVLNVYGYELEVVKK